MMWRLILCILFLAHQTLGQALIDSEAFARQAQALYASQKHLYNLKPMNDDYLCELEKTIALDLVAMDKNQKSIILFDHLCIKNYSSSVLTLDFSFVQDLKSGKFYFVCFPALQLFPYFRLENYEPTKNRQYKLLPGHGFQKLNFALLDSVLEHAVFNEVRYSDAQVDETLFYRDVNKVNLLIATFLPNLGNGPLYGMSEIHADLKANKINEADYKRCQEFLDGYKNLGDSYSYQYGEFGYLVIGMRPGPKRIQTTFMFLPYKTIPHVVHADSLPHDECFSSKPKD